MTKPRCETCRFWDESNGRCKRLSPRPSTPNESDHVNWNHDLTIWPIVSSGDWCGEWQSRTALNGFYCDDRVAVRLDQVKTVSAEFNRVDFIDGNSMLLAEESAKGLIKAIKQWSRQLLAQSALTNNS